MTSRLLPSLALVALATSALTLFACSSSSSGESSDGGSDGASDGPITHAPKEHRPSPTTCTPSTSPGSCPATPPPAGDCKTDADCTAGTNGHCVQAGGGILLCNCAYDNCVTDGDCTGSGVCACQGSPYQFASNACTPQSDCKVDADCGAGGFCSPSQGTGCSNALTGYHCHTSSDECVDTSDCTKADFCAFDTAKKHWACFPMVACG
jgi:hypothetical protein